MTVGWLQKNIQVNGGNEKTPVMNLQKDLDNLVL